MTPEAPARGLPAALGSWIQPRHLEPDGLEAARARFASSPHDLLVVDGFLGEGLAERVGAFLAAEGSYSRQYMVQPGRVVEEAEWMAASPGRRFARDEVLEGVQSERRLTANLMAFMQLRTRLQNAEVVEYLRRVTGLPLRGTTGPDDEFAKRMGPGDFLARHNDTVGGRALALSLHLTGEWQPAYGGQLVLQGGTRAERAVETGWNRLVITGLHRETQHEVVPISPAAGEHRRYTIHRWFG